MTDNFVPDRMGDRNTEPQRGLAAIKVCSQHGVTIGAYGCAGCLRAERDAALEAAEEARKVADANRRGWETAEKREEEAVERTAGILEGLGIELDPDMGTETGDPAEYLAHQIAHYIGGLNDRVDAAQHQAAEAEARLAALVLRLEATLNAFHAEHMGRQPHQGDKDEWRSCTNDACEMLRHPLEAQTSEGQGSATSEEES